MSKNEQANITVTPEAAEHLRHFGLAHGTLLQAVQALVAEGLAAKMVRHARKPISPSWLAQTCTWPGILDIAARFRDAVRREIGLVGPEGGKYRFVPVPAETQWAEPGRTVYVIMDDKWGLNDQGEAVILPTQPGTVDAAWEAFAAGHCETAGPDLEEKWFLMLEKMFPGKTEQFTTADWIKICKSLEASE